VVAVQLDLKTMGFTYEKWGAVQTCQAGDWIVENNGDTYTVDRESFARTYQSISPGLYRKVAPVWAEQANEAGSISTKEGVTHFQVGDYLVANEETGGDGYAVTAAKFQEMYEPA